MASLPGKSEDFWLWVVGQQLWFRRRHCGRCFNRLTVQIGCPDPSPIRCLGKHTNTSRLRRSSHRYLQTGNNLCQVGRILRRYRQRQSH